MKEVEMTETGLLITERFFFYQKTDFVPYEKIRTVKNNLWFIGNKARTTVNFTEETTFGIKIRFIADGWTRKKHGQIGEKLNRAVVESKIAGQIDSALPEAR